MFGGRFALVRQFHDPPRRDSSPDVYFTGSAVEAFITQAVGRHFAVKGGVTFDFNFERINEPLATPDTLLEIETIARVRTS
jgi:hypothetical protein